MIKPLFLTLAALLAAVLPASAQLQWETLSQESAVSEARTATARTQAEWNALWIEHAGKRNMVQAKVDFSREMIVAVFLGEKPTTGWTVELKTMPDSADPSRLVVFHRAVPPDAKTPVLQVVTHPCAMAKVALAQTVAFQADTELKMLQGGLASAPAPLRGAGEPLKASQTRLQRFFDGEWYMSWGYNTETWAPMDIHVSQPSLGNDFVIHDMKGHDEKGWDSELLQKGITIPQYQFIVGRFIDKKKTLAVEFNWDHTKYSSTLGQTAHVTGTIDGKPVDEMRKLDRDFFNYKLHNGANHVMVNVVKRMPIIGEPSQRFSVCGIAKAGAGIMLPHAENTVMKQELDLGEKGFGNIVGKHRGWWQTDGWTAGLEAGVRVAVRPFFVEFTDKVAYSRMSDIPVYQGTAEHDLWMNELTLSLGVTINGGKKVARR